MTRPAAPPPPDLSERTWNATRELRIESGPVVISQTRTDPGDMGEPRVVESDGVTYVAVPDFDSQWSLPGLDEQVLAIAGLKAIEQMERERPTDWANYMAGEGTIAAAMAGALFGEKIAAEYAALLSDTEASRP